MNPLVANDPINERADREGWAGGGKKIIGRPTLSKLEIPSIIVLYTITMELRFVPMENSCNSAENKWTASFSARSSPSLSPTHPLSLCFSFVLHETRFRVNESTFLINELHDNLSVHHSMESSSEEFPSTSILLSFFPIFFFFLIIVVLKWNSWNLRTIRLMRPVVENYQLFLFSILSFQFFTHHTLFVTWCNINMYCVDVKYYTYIKL